MRFPEFREIIRNCSVYARTTPEQKQQIVALLKLLKAEEDTLFGFCGDGANDTLALKEADIGLSLSLDDASLAAPFVSTDTELTSVENLIIEGRGAITCNFQNFKYFLYLSIVQCFGTVTLFFTQVDFNNLSYIWMDIIIGIPYSILLGNLLSKRKISKILPPNSLMTYNTLLSFVIHLIYAAILIVFSSRAVRYLPNY